MSQRIPIFIPTYINSAEYAPARVLPRLFFYNGLVDCEEYWIESGSLAFGGVTYSQTAFPYFDNYNVVTGSFPSTGSKSLLFNNEQSVYGTMPNANLYTEYWETYINLLYNPKTRLLECAAIIPLADYINMELNDVVNFRGNYYHLRAINDYSLKTGQCNLQLLGPIIPDTFTARYPVPPTTTTTTSTTTTSTTTTTTTSTTTTTTTLAPDCRVYSLTNNNSVTVFWGATKCDGSGEGGSIPPGATRYTTCIIPGTINSSGTLTITQQAIC
jgi:hypothetical protein